VRPGPGPHPALAVGDQPVAGGDRGRRVNLPVTRLHRLPFQCITRAPRPQLPTAQALLPLIAATL